MAASAAHITSIGQRAAGRKKTADNLVLSSSGMTRRKASEALRSALAGSNSFGMLPGASCSCTETGPNRAWGGRDDASRWAKRVSASLIGRVWPLVPGGNSRNCQKCELMVFITTAREAGGMALKVLATAAARSRTRSSSEVSFSCSLPRSNHQATPKLEITTAAAVTAINCTTRVRGQIFGFQVMLLPVPSRRCSRLPKRF